MGAGQSIYQQLLAQREAQQQYQFDFMPPARKAVPYVASLDYGGVSIHVIATDFGQHGMMLQSIRLLGPDKEQAENGPEGLMRLVQNVAVDVDCPYGPIKCIENDENLTNALLRTDPTAEGCYFEIVVDGGRVADLRHYEITGPARERRETAVNLGRRVFEKMVDGLAEAFCDGL